MNGRNVQRLRVHGRANRRSWRTKCGERRKRRPGSSRNTSTVPGARRQREPSSYTATSTRRPPTPPPRSTKPRSSTTRDRHLPGAEERRPAETPAPGPRRGDPAHEDPLPERGLPHHLQREPVQPQHLRLLAPVRPPLPRPQPRPKARNLKPSNSYSNSDTEKRRGYPASAMSSPASLERVDDDSGYPEKVKRVVRACATVLQRFRDGVEPQARQFGCVSVSDDGGGEEPPEGPPEAGVVGGPPGAAPAGGGVVAVVVVGEQQRGRRGFGVAPR
ncbi:unnamed protein product [Bemisia tabaci]|uniref:Uncharacterized protein n=1 Tax=Bemisia tabaci TaxID=7038 RepID=A0A9P0F9L7_BEMTA|nr:unnamed protein product [Bemisia tabaci]